MEPEQTKATISNYDTEVTALSIRKKLSCSASWTLIKYLPFLFRYVTDQVSPFYVLLDFSAFACIWSVHLFELIMHLDKEHLPTF